MAKSAKAAEIEITERMMRELKRNIGATYDELESAKGTYMNRSRRIRDNRTAIYEGFAQRGIPQKLAKQYIETLREEVKTKAKLADLDAEQRKLLQQMFRAGGEKLQLSLFADLPRAPKPEKDEAPKERKAREPKPPKGASGEDIGAAMETAQGNA